MEDAAGRSGIIAFVALSVGLKAKTTISGIGAVLLLLAESGDQTTVRQSG